MKQKAQVSRKKKELLRYIYILQMMVKNVCKRGDCFCMLNVFVHARSQEYSYGK